VDARSAPCDLKDNRSLDARHKHTQAIALVYLFLLAVLRNENLKGRDVAKEHQPDGRAATNLSAGELTRRASSDEATRFAEDLRRRAEAARGLEKDLLTDVPLLYGSPGRGEPCGDPGIALARIHREALIRKHEGGVPSPSGKVAAKFPFERTTVAIAVLIAIVLLSGILG
jgi:hypothetical protein